MSTLFQLHTDIDKYKKHLQEAFSYLKTEDSLLIMGSTVTICDWILDYATELNAVMSSSVHWYVLQADMQSLNSVLQQNIDLEERQINVINNIEWVQLVQSASKVVTIAS